MSLPRVEAVSCAVAATWGSWPSVESVANGLEGFPNDVGARQAGYKATGMVVPGCTFLRSPGCFGSAVTMPTAWGYNKPVATTEELHPASGPSETRLLRYSRWGDFPISSSQANSRYLLGSGTIHL